MQGRNFIDIKNLISIFYILRLFILYLFFITLQNTFFFIDQYKITYWITIFWMANCIMKIEFKEKY